MELDLFTSSWENLFKVIRNQPHPLETKGNFWAAIQSLERQHAKKEQEHKNSLEGI